MMGVSNDPGTWVMAFIMLSLFSFLWKESPFSKIAEAIYAGAAAGYMLALSYKNVKDMAIHPLTQGKSTLIVPIVLGLLLYCSLSKKYSHLSRYGTAIPIGIGTGLALRALLSAQILSQIQATVLPVNSLSNIFIIVGVVTTLSYFLFTTSQNKVVRISAEIGKNYMMVAFGLTFATAVFTHIAIYFGALQLLLGDWLGLM
jgi:hypothetical protein